MTQHMTTPSFARVVLWSALNVRRSVLMLASIGALVASGCGGHGAGHGANHDAGDGRLPDARPGMLDVTGNALFVALGTAGGVAVVDVDAWRVAGTIQLSTTYFPHHLSLSPDRTRVAIGAPASDLSGGHGDGGHGAGGGALYIVNSRTGDAPNGILYRPAL